MANSYSETYPARARQASPHTKMSMLTSPGNTRVRLRGSAYPHLKRADRRLLLVLDGGPLVLRFGVDLALRPATVQSPVALTHLCPLIHCIALVNV